MDECQGPVAVCDVNANCSNTYGSYFCTCRAGYTGNGSQCDGKISCKLIILVDALLHYDADIDECALGLDICHPNATCHNTAGNYTCMCIPGFTGDGFTCTGIEIDCFLMYKWFTIFFL